MPPLQDTMSITCLKVKLTFSWVTAGLIETASLVGSIANSLVPELK